MIPISEDIRRSDLFDAEWYVATYRDVASSGLDPADHFARYGAAMGRDPGPDFSSIFYANSRRDPLAPGMVPFFHHLLLGDAPEGATCTEKVVRAAAEVGRVGQRDRAVTIAERHLPPTLAHTADILRANRSLVGGDEGEWAARISAYLNHFDSAPVRLGPGDTILDRLTTSELPAVADGLLVSVIMPAWNAAETVETAARSVLNQTWRNLELLIVDDASEDGTWAILQSLAASDRRVRVFRNAVNVGPYVSKNLVLRRTGGDWITGHDADDWAHPQRIEHHVRAVREAGSGTRASSTFMIRMEENGLFDRLATVAPYSFDGVARQAPVSCLFERAFLLEALGGWDCVRFGADSEILSRARSLLGDGYREFRQIGMICLNRDDSLTNHAVTGVDHLAGPMEPRLAYGRGWSGWHASLRDANAVQAPLTFPPDDAAPRPFTAPQAALVAPHAIRRNHAALTGDDAACRQPVTALCVSRRPEYARRLATMMNRQTHPHVRVIYVAHGHDGEGVAGLFDGVEAVSVLSLTDEGSTLGDALNLGLAHCQTDLVAKIDDDDVYGPDYLRRALAALAYSGHDDVGLVGKASAYCYLQGSNVTGLKHGPGHRNTLWPHVFGGTIVWSRTATGHQDFESLSVGEDAAFYRALLAKGVALYSGEPSDYVYVRYATAGVHSWIISDIDFSRKMTVQAQGLDLAVAFSGEPEASSGLADGIETKQSDVSRD